MLIAEFKRRKGSKDKKKRKGRLIRNTAVGLGSAAALALLGSKYKTQLIKGTSKVYKSAKERGLGAGEAIKRGVYRGKQQGREYVERASKSKGAKNLASNLRKYNRKVNEVYNRSPEVIKRGLSGVNTVKKKVFDIVDRPIDWTARKMVRAKTELGYLLNRKKRTN